MRLLTAATMHSSCRCRYDVELFQKIEALTGKKMELFQAEQVTHLLMTKGCIGPQSYCSPPHLQLGSAAVGELFGHWLMCASNLQNWRLACSVPACA